MSNEWQYLFEISRQLKEEWSKLSFGDMCSAIASFCTDSGHKMFPNLTLLLNRVHTLPHFNAEAERTFSMLTDAKTNKRNWLGTKIVNSMCVTCSALKARNTGFFLQFKIFQQYSSTQTSVLIFFTPCLFIFLILVVYFLIFIITKFRQLCKIDVSEDGGNGFAIDILHSSRMK